jgi:hypothetical protein
MISSLSTLEKMLFNVQGTGKAPPLSLIAPAFMALSHDEIKFFIVFSSLEFDDKLLRYNQADGQS